jgi:hypothetical protein
MMPFNPKLVARTCLKNNQNSIIKCNDRNIIFNRAKKIDDSLLEQIKELLLNVNREPVLKSIYNQFSICDSTDNFVKYCNDDPSVNTHARNHLYNLYRYKQNKFERDLEQD